MSRKKTLLRYNSKDFPLAIQPLIEIDYAHKLNESEIEFLAAFNEATYGSPNAIAHITKKRPTKKQRQKVWRETKRIQRSKGSYSENFVPLQDVIETARNPQENEDVIITRIDAKNALSKRK